LDHIHIVFASKPQVQLSKFINSLKSTSARLIFRDCPEVKKKLWGGNFWSPSYFLSTIGEEKLEDVKKYVQSQGNP
jgi:putative transposase